MAKGVAILGSTGSIGRSALSVVANHAARLRVVALSAGRNIPELVGQIQRHQPELVSVADQQAARELTEALKAARYRCKLAVHHGDEGLRAVATHPGADQVLVAVVGFRGLLPTLAALRAGKRVALANKESLVVGGHLVMTEAAEAAKRRSDGIALIPVDSEHSAVFQCLHGSRRHEVASLHLTASGGPFREHTLAEMALVTPDQALRHPNWSMGPKITVDSATLMNKGLEVLEAHWLFGLSWDQIRVVVHPQSIVHSLVEFVDGSYLAQLGAPDMCLPIQYALLYPERHPGPGARLDLLSIQSLTFSRPDTHRFPCLALAYEAGRVGGTMPAVLNAANEVAVERFLAHRLRFLDIPKVVRDAMEKHAPVQNPDVTNVLEADRWARRVAQEWKE